MSLGWGAWPPAVSGWLRGSLKLYRSPRPSRRVRGRESSRTQVSLCQAYRPPGDLDTHHSPTQAPACFSEHPLLLSFLPFHSPHRPSQVVGHSPSPRLPLCNPSVFPFHFVILLKSADRLLLAPHHLMPPSAPPQLLLWCWRGEQFGGCKGAVAEKDGERYQNSHPRQPQPSGLFSG